MRPMTRTTFVSMIGVGSSLEKQATALAT